MPKIYEQFDAAFRRVAADLILYDGAAVGRIAWKYPADGAGRLYCYLQIWGGPMVRAFASGGGYDKRGAAFHAAVRKLEETVCAEGAYHSEKQGAALQALATLESDQWNTARRDLETLGVLIQHVID